MDLERLTVADKLTVGSALVLAVATFMSWFRIDVFGSTVDVTGWELGWLTGRIPLLLGALMAGHAVLARLAPQVSLPAFDWDRAHLAAGAAAVALVGLRLLFGYEIRGFDCHRTAGIGLAAVAALGLLASAVLRRRTTAGEPA